MRKRSADNNGSQEYLHNLFRPFVIYGDLPNFHVCLSLFENHSTGRTFRKNSGALNERINKKYIFCLLSEATKVSFMMFTEDKVWENFKLKHFCESKVFVFIDFKLWFHENFRAFLIDSANNVEWVKLKAFLFVLQWKLSFVEEENFRDSATSPHLSGLCELKNLFHVVSLNELWSQ